MPVVVKALAVMDGIEALMASNPTRSSLTYQAMGVSRIDLCSTATSVWDANIQPETKGDCNTHLFVVQTESTSGDWQGKQPVAA